MRVSVLVTNNGEHSPEKWAYATANRLIDVDLNSDNFVAAQKLQATITELLVKHHTEVQDTEQAALTANADQHLQTPIDVQANVDAAFNDIVAAANGTPWEAKFHEPDVQAGIRHLLGADFHTSKQIKREWHGHRAKAAQG